MNGRAIARATPAEADWAMAGAGKQWVLCAALALSALLPLPPAPAFAQGALDGGELRLRPLDATQQRSGDASEEAPAAPSDPGRIDRREIENGGTAREPVAPEPPIAPEPAETPPPALDFDLFAGPETPPTAARASAPAAPAGRAPAAGSQTADEPAAPPALPFRAIGPVRSPTFAPAGAQERINRAVAGLRPSFPILDTDPFAATGIAVSRFRLFPVLEQEIGAADNLDEDVTEDGGVFSQTRLSARLLSDWVRHQAELNASATYRRNHGGAVRDDPSVALDGRVGFDLAAQTTATLRGALSYAREDPITADPLLAAAVRPEILSYSFGADVARPFGRAALSAAGDVVREERDFRGQVTNDDFTTATVGLRAGYELTPALRPFLTGSYGRRFFDDGDAASGLDRDSDILALRGGVALDFGEKLSGEAAFGYAWNRPSDGALPTLSAPTIDLALNWSPRRGTDVLLTGTTFFDPERSNLSTSTVYETALGVRHRATARIDLTGRVSLAYRDRDGAGTSNDATYAAEAGVVYWINRGLALTALARHLQLKSDQEAAEYAANSIRVGVRLQR